MAKEVNIFTWRIKNDLPPEFPTEQIRREFEHKAREEANAELYRRILQRGNITTDPFRSKD